MADKKAPQESRFMADRHELRFEFKYVDRDADGRIDRAEFEELLLNLDAGMSKLDMKIGFEALDVNHDGLIDSKEFIEWWLSD